MRILLVTFFIASHLVYKLPDYGYALDMATTFIPVKIRSSHPSFHMIFERHYTISALESRFSMKSRSFLFCLATISLLLTLIFSWKKVYSGFFSETNTLSVPRSPEQAESSDALIQAELSDALLRLHIIANSDTEADQTVKLHIRDAILEAFQADFTDMPDKHHAVTLAQSLLQQAEDIANHVLTQEGFSDTASASLTRCTFPEKTYGAYTFPAGEYDALRITIGKAAGHNWWCVLYPPLCFDDLSSPMPEHSDALLRQNLSVPAYESLLADHPTQDNPSTPDMENVPSVNTEEAEPDTPRIQFRFFPFLNNLLQSLTEN